MLELLINGAFRGQRITGQQRYATEIASALKSTSRTPTKELRIPRALEKSRLLSWAWAQLVACRVTKHSYLLTLTSRGPVFSPRHVLVVHDLFVINHPEWYSTFYAVSHSLVMKIQLRTANLLVAVSAPVAEQVKRATGNRVPVVVAPNAPATEFVRAIDSGDLQRRLRRLGLSPKNYLLTVATKDPRKNLDLLLQAYGRLPPDRRAAVPLVIAGGHSDGVFNFRGSPAFEYGTSLGHVSDADLAALYSGSRAVLFPSLDEGFGLPAVEALACGAQLIASDIPVLRWVCGPFAQFLPPESGDAWANTISDLVSHGTPALSGPERQKRREYVRSRFTWRDSAMAIEAGILARQSQGRYGVRGGGNSAKARE